MSAGKAAVKSGRHHSMTRAEFYFLAFFGGCRSISISFASWFLPSTPFCSRALTGGIGAATRAVLSFRSLLASHLNQLTASTHAGQA